ncbi:MAG: hypothetical protein HY060_07575, partial [Proteobacteria bacterium]|nr:hypothetical protein [Pseudomonadota bacterium]
MPRQARPRRPAKPPPAKAPTRPSAAATTPAPPRPLIHRLAGFAARWLFVAAIWVVLTVGGVLGWYALQLPPIDKLEESWRRP